jgi:hypothetical protein
MSLDHRVHPDDHYGVLQKSCVILLIAVLLGLVPAAYADPPDPTWIGGYWDDDDFDDAVILIVSACAVQAPSLIDCGPLWAILVDHVPSPPRFVQTSSRDAPSPRAPPAALLPAS